MKGDMIKIEINTNLKDSTTHCLFWFVSLHWTCLFCGLSNFKHKMVLVSSVWLSKSFGSQMLGTCVYKFPGDGGALDCRPHGVEALQSKNSFASTIYAFYFLLSGLIRSCLLMVASLLVFNDDIEGVVDLFGRHLALVWAHTVANDLEGSPLAPSVGNPPSGTERKPCGQSCVSVPFLSILFLCRESKNSLGFSLVHSLWGCMENCNEMTSLCSDGTPLFISPWCFCHGLI